MRLLTLTYEFPPVGGGGARVARELARELEMRGHEIDVLTMRYKTLPSVEQLGPNLRVIRVASLRRNVEICRTHEMLSYVLSALPTAVRLAKRTPYDLCHAHFILPTGIVAGILKTITGLPYILSSHGSDVPGYNPDRFLLEHRVTPPIVRNIVKHSSGVIVPSGYLKELILRCDPGRAIEIVPHGIDVRKIVPSSQKDKSILVVTRMFQRKGVQYLLEALRGVNLRGFTVNIVGDGPYLDTLKAIARESQVDVTFWGWLDGDSRELLNLYERSSIFVMTSEAESFGMVLLDAMSAGLAVVTANGGGCEEVTGDSALLVPPRDPSAIRTALTKLIEDQRMRNALGEKARSRVEQCFHWPVLAARYEHLMARC